MIDRDISGTTTVVGVIGYSLLNSSSPLIHQAAFHLLKLDWVNAPVTVKPSAYTLTEERLRALVAQTVSVHNPWRQVGYYRQPDWHEGVIVAKLGYVIPGLRQVVEGPCVFPLLKELFV